MDAAGEVLSGDEFVLVTKNRPNGAAIKAGAGLNGPNRRRQNVGFEATLE
jgi:hypothetical protein